MYEEEDNYMYTEEDEPEEIPVEKWQEYSWITISAFFEEKGKSNISNLSIKIISKKSRQIDLVLYYLAYEWCNLTNFSYLLG